MRATIDVNSNDSDAFNKAFIGIINTSINAWSSAFKKVSYYDSTTWLESGCNCLQTERGIKAALNLLERLLTLGKLLNGSAIATPELQSLVENMKNITWLNDDDSIGKSTWFKDDVGTDNSDEIPVN